MAGKKVDLIKAKQKKQRMIAIGGGILLLALIAFQVPRVMKQLNKKPPVSAVTSTTAAPAPGTPELAPPTLKGAEQSATTPGLTASDTSGSVTSGDAAPAAQPGQLASFSRFASKDPFAQQMSTTTSAGAPSGGGSSGGSSSPGLSPSGGGSVPSSGSGTTGGTSAPAPGSVVMSVNGTLVSVTVGTDFPQATASDPTLQPLFHLVSATLHSVRISIAGGSYSNGAASVTLRENKPVTLMNTADGTKFRLILEPQGTAVPASTGSTSSAAPPASTTPSG